jgi:hypothetical protein
MLAATSVSRASLAAPAQRAPRLQSRRSVAVKATAATQQPEPAADLGCPLQCASAADITHAAAAVATSQEAAWDHVSLPRAMAKAKCVHPQRPVGQACPDCPRRK